MKILNKFLDVTERFIIVTLVLFMALVLIIATVEVGGVVIKGFIDTLKSTGHLLDIDSFMDIFGFFLIVLIGFELFETVKLYLKEKVFHGEVILMVSLIAVARKIIIIDYSNENPLTVFAMSTLILFLSIGYYLIKKTLRQG